MKNYENLFENIIVVDPLYGTCGIFLPYNIEIDINEICFKSGYIHSCGYNIYTRKIYKATESELLEKLEKYLSKEFEKQKIPFTLYAHEDFTPFDRNESKDFFNDGLDEIKFYVEKLYFGDITLTKLLENISTDKRFKEKLEISMPGDYHKNIKGKSKKSIWIINDKSISPNEPKQGIYKYLICYEQKIINENPFHLFDENKPAWIDHVTIPHTLMGAMLNLGLSNHFSKRKMKILDPFHGSGTTLLELLKYQEFSFNGSDLSPISKIVIEDNLAFFKMKEKDLNELEFNFKNLKISLIYDFIKNQNKLIKDEKEKLTSEMKVLFTKLYSNQKKFSIVNIKKMAIVSSFDEVAFHIDELVTKNAIKKDNLVSQKIKLFNSIDKRLLFYIGLKTFKRKDRAIFERKTLDATIGYIKELDDLILQISNLRKLLIRIHNDKNNNAKSVKGKTCCIYLGNFSNAVSINPESISNSQGMYVIEEKIDVLIKLKNLKIENRKFDLIITDPPYGFNTNEQTIKFSNLFSDLFNNLTDLLEDMGQIIICLPEWSHTGRKVAYFTQRQLIIHQIIQFANNNGLELLSPYQLIPKPNWLFQPPYYWESEKALKRSIIHFAFQRKK